MISKAEQQLVLKSQDKAEIKSFFSRDVLAHKRFEGSSLIKDFELTPSSAFEAVTVLGEPAQVDFVADGRTWTVTLGGQKAKKISQASGEVLELVIAKAMIIYVRKYL